MDFDVTELDRPPERGFHPKAFFIFSKNLEMFSPDCLIKITAEIKNMSDQATLEIKKIDGKRDIRSEIITFSFDDASAVSPALSGSRINFNNLTVRLPGGDADYMAVHWFRNTDQIYPEMIIKGKFSSGANGTRTRAVFTFFQVKINGYGTDKDASGEFIFIFKIGFEKVKYVLDSTAGVMK